LKEENPSPVHLAATLVSSRLTPSLVAGLILPVVMKEEDTGGGALIQSSSFRWQQRSLVMGLVFPAAAWRKRISVVAPSFSFLVAAKRSLGMGLALLVARGGSA